MLIKEIVEQPIIVTGSIAQLTTFNEVEAAIFPAPKPNSPILLMTEIAFLTSLDISRKSLLLIMHFFSSSLVLYSVLSYLIPYKVINFS